MRKEDVLAAPFMEAGNYKHGTGICVSSVMEEGRRARGCERAGGDQSYFYNKYIHMMANPPQRKGHSSITWTHEAW